jgi:hypothetical protein
MTERQELIEKLTQFMQKTGITQAKLAKQIGTSPTALSQWLQNNYGGNNENLDEQIVKFLEFQQEKSKSKIAEFKFVPTSVAKQVFIAAQNCQMDSLIGICYGDSGLGKTTAIKEYAKNNTGVIVIECEERMKPKLLIETLYKKLNLGSEKNWDLQDMKEKILNKLKDSGWLIVIDEAEWLNEESFTVLRRLHDFSECSFGILFTGITKLYNNLMKLKGEYMYLTITLCFRPDSG